MVRRKHIEDKIVTTMYVRKDVKEFAKENKINLSEYLNDKFMDEFLGINSRIRELGKCKTRIIELNKEIEEIKANIEFVRKSMTDSEVRYLKKVRTMQRKGYNINAMKNQFNEQFNREYTLDEFVAMSDFYEEQEQRRLKFALSKANQKKKLYQKRNK